MRKACDWSQIYSETEQQPKTYSQCPTELNKEKQAMEMMVWPPQGPNFNIIVPVWDYMRRQDLRQSTATKYLWVVLQAVLNNLPANLVCASVPLRIDAPLEAKCGQTNY